jgi:hypothetical protein
VERPLFEQVQTAIIAQWQRSEGLIDSEDVYTQLIKQGVLLPDGVMGEALSRCGRYEAAWGCGNHAPEAARLVSQGPA